MLDILDEVLAARASGRRVVLAVVTATWSSSPRPVGAGMAVLDDGTSLGSVSGGCVEGDVHARAMELLTDGDTDGDTGGADGAAPAEGERVRYGVGDDEALGAGLACGGTVEVLLQLLDDRMAAALERLAADRDRGAAVLVLDVGQDGVVVRAEPPPRLVVAGSGPVAAALVALGRALGRRTAVVDAREAFATRARHPAADDVVVDWPHRHVAAEAAAGRLGPGDALVVLTHDPKFDLPLLEVALRLDLGYVGALGSRRTCADRRRHLRERGLTDVELDRLHAPVGLDLGARTPAEIALSIAAEVLAVHRGRTGAPLRETSGRVSG